MFFNKENVRVNPRADTDLILNIPNTLTFYVSEVISNSTIEQVSIQAYTKEAKNITILNTFTDVDTNTNGDYEYTFTPTAEAKDTLYFRFKVVTNEMTHIVDSVPFSVNRVGVA